MRWALTRKQTSATEPYPRRRESLVSDRILDRAGRLAIYSEAYVLRLRDALGAVFPRTRRALGGEAFERRVHGYLGEFPSTSYTIEDVGFRLADYLARDPRPPYLGELAALEWAMHEAFYADDEFPLDPTTLTSAKPEAWEGATFHLDPAVRLLACRYRVDVDCAAIPAHYLVYRHEDRVYVSDIGATASRVLADMRDGRTLGELSHSPESAEVQRVFQEFFPKWISQSVIRRVVFPT
jgi:hypothetical protein